MHPAQLSDSDLRQLARLVALLDGLAAGATPVTPEATPQPARALRMAARRLARPTVPGNRSRPTR